MNTNPKDHQGWACFVEFCGDTSIGDPNELHEDDWLPWWECWVAGYQQGQQDAIDGGEGA